MKWLWIVLGIIVVGGLIYYFGFFNKGQNSSSSSNDNQTATLNGITINIANFAFSPNNLNIKVGDKVTWTNNDSVTHHVVSDTGVFDSGDMSQGQAFNFTFNTAGSYSYHCSIHPEMTGTIIVK